MFGSLLPGFLTESIPNDLLERFSQTRPVQVCQSVVRGVY